MVLRKALLPEASGSVSAARRTNCGMLRAVPPTGSGVSAISTSGRATMIQSPAPGPAKIPWRSPTTPSPPTPTAQEIR